jgi:glycosyltransferase involved in cell wall biosynthesis
MDLLILSSLSRDSGAYLRGLYLAEALRRGGHRVAYPRPPASQPLMLDFALQAVPCAWAAFRRPWHAAVVIKPYPQTLAPLLARRTLRGGRVVVDVDDIDSGYRSGLLPRLLDAAQRPWPRRCDAVTCHNDALRDHVISHFRVPPERIWPLDQGVDLTRFRPLGTDTAVARRSALRRSFGLEGREVAVYAGHLNIASDLDAILPAFERAAAQRPGLRLVVVGGGPMRAHFERLAAPLVARGLVAFTGHVPPETVNDWFNAADLALVYYKPVEVNRHRVSMKIRESLAAGAAVVCNDFGDLAAFRDVTFQSASDPGAFAAAIVQSLDNPAARAERAAKGRAFVAERFDWQAIARGFSQRLEALAAAPARG